MNKIKAVLLLLILTLLLLQCKSNSTGPDNEPIDIAELILSDSVALNPSGYSPLTATIDLSTEIPVKIDIEVLGINDPGTLTHAFDEVNTSHKVMVLGLYADYANTVGLTFSNEDGAVIGTKWYTIVTEPLIADLPDVEIDVANTSAMVPGWTLVSYFGHRIDGSINPQRALMFDSNGDIRWHLDFSQHPVLKSLFFDDGAERLANGNLYFGDGSSQKIYEVDMLGNIINSWDVGVFGYGFHHQVIEKDNGNFILTANKFSESTIEDYVVEIDRDNGLLLNSWDFKESLEYDRRAWPANNQDVDWFHGNALVHDKNDNSIIVSGRTQGVVKFNADNEVIWIMAPHRDWGISGDGKDLNQFLLQPLDANDQPITNEAVLDGTENHPDFEWNWYQHAPQLLPNGNIMLFDNGDNRNYVNFGPYSRAVEFEIDETNMTIRQVWEYGKERGEETYSKIVSDIDYYPEENHVFFSPGAIKNNGNYGKVIEIDYDTKEVFFEATIRAPQAAWNIITFHRTERMSIYPPSTQ
jgi:arylsulfate sulfotransferase